MAMSMALSNSELSWCDVGIYVGERIESGHLANFNSTDDVVSTRLAVEWLGTGWFRRGAVTIGNHLLKIKFIVQRPYAACRPSYEMILG